MIFAIAVAVGLLLAYANGANDNFKGVATLFGSSTASYRTALAWATLTTALGSLAALVVARGLLAAFSGKGLVPAEVVANPGFASVVAVAAGATVLLATRLGFPISTTHALIGGLVGAGSWLSPVGIDWQALGRGFLAPLLASPALAILLVVAVYPVSSAARRALRVDHETCLCIGREVVATLPGRPSAEQSMLAIRQWSVRLGSVPACKQRYRGTILGWRVDSMLNAAHFLSAGIVGFARGLNDTPKIAALLLAGSALSADAALVAVGVMIAAGGLLSARRVAETMSHRVTEMNAGQGLTANLVTGLIVVGASQIGVPVSTTHVSCGALFGIGATTRQARWSTISQILLAWLVTLPLAASLAVLGAAALWTLA